MTSARVQREVRSAARSAALCGLVGVGVTGAERGHATRPPSSLVARDRRQRQAGPGLMAAGVTVAVPVFNGARYLDEVLGAVRAQRIDRELEILVVDSCSTDGSREIAARHGARVLEIPKTEFSHGGTRNRMMELAEGEHVAFITQDATPAHDGWLAALLAGFEAGDDVALVFGPHEARPDASHMIKCEMERHFATFGNGGVDVQRLGHSAAEISGYRRFPGRWTFFSDVNGCVAKWAWR